MNTALIIITLVVAACILRSHFNRHRKAEVARIEREVENILDIIGNDHPAFFRPDRISELERVALSFEFRLIPLYRAAFRRRDVVLEEAPKSKQKSHSHQLRFYRNTIPVSNYVDITDVAVVERAA